MNDLTPEVRERVTGFVRQALNKSGFEIFQLAGDASSRKYYRIVSSEDSWVLMYWEPFVDDGNYPFLSVRDHFAKHGVQVPNVVGKSPELGLVLLEDLGDLTLERKFWENQNQRMVIPYYQQALDEIIKIHYPTTLDRGNCTAFKIEFDTEKLLWEMNYGRDHLLTGLCGVALTDIEKKELEHVFTSICTTLHQEQKFIAHRDYHSRNLMIKFNKMRVIDFQDARLGPVQYDLVSLMCDSYVQMDDEIARELIAYYLRQRDDLRLGTQIRETSAEHFQKIYEIQTIQRCFKASGSFSSFYNLRQDTRYLKYLTPILQTVKKSLWPFAEYRTFYNILNDRGIFDKKFEAV